MRLGRIEISGWMPFGNSVVLELPNGPIAVVGTHAGDGRRSNRAGKTALLEAVTWCLYGVHRKRLDDSIIHRGSDEASVQLTVGKMLVSRSRKRGSSTKLVVRVDSEELTGKAAQEKIERAVGMGIEDYLATSCFRQGDVEAIITRTASERLTLVGEWLQQSRWFDAKKIQSARAHSADQRLVTVKGTRDAVEPQRITPALRDAMVAEIGRHKEEVSRLAGLMESTREHMAAIVNREQIEQDKLTLERVREDAKACRQKLAGRAQAISHRETVEASWTQARHNRHAAKKELDEVIKVRRTGFDGTCPVTCEQCPVAEDVTRIARDATALLNDRMEAERKAGLVEAELASQQRDARAAEAGFEREAARYQMLVARGKELSERIGEAPDLADDDVTREFLRTELAGYQTAYAKASERIGELECMLEAGVHAEERHASLVKTVQQHEHELQASRLALRAISAVPARIAAEQLGELEREANQLLAGTGVSLRFSWMRELADKAPVCDECGYIFRDKRGDTCPACSAERGRKMAQELELLCDDGSGAEEDVRYNSGGTRAIVGAAVRLSASAMLRRLRSSQAAWAIVDEPFGPLDAENREMLARTFAGMLGSVGLEQALVVSHDPLLLAALPHCIIVDKNGAESTARLE